jgi:hypothetical protein
MTIMLTPIAGRAQTVTAVEATMRGVDCHAQTLTLSIADGPSVFSVTPHTAAFVNSVPVGMCTLRQYVGDPATVWLTASGPRSIVQRIYVSVGTGPAGPEPVPGDWGSEHLYGPGWWSPWFP